VIEWHKFYLPPINLYNRPRNNMDRENESGMNEEEMYVEFTMIEINEFISRYGAEFFLSKLKYPNLMAIIRELP
jgi:hypothetical protein